MPRPKSKDQLLSLSQENLDKLYLLVESMSEEEQREEFPPGTLNRNIRDVFMHLHHWHLLFLEWHKVGMAGEKPAMPAPGYTWRTVPDLNQWIQQQYEDVDLEDAREKLRKSHQQMMDLIASYSDEALFEKKRYAWTGSTSLGAYLVSATSSHYDWARKLIRRIKK